MKRTLSVIAIASLILGSLAWGATVITEPFQSIECRDKADVMLHLDRSRNGVSLSCHSRMIAKQQGASGE